MGRTAGVVKTPAGSILGRSSSFLLLRSCFNVYPRRRNAAQQGHSNNGEFHIEARAKHGKQSNTPKTTPKKGIHIMLSCLAIIY